MQAKINELVAKFVECENCTYEKSFLFPESLQFGNFEWFCPNCNQLWKGILNKEGIISIEKQSDEESYSVILIRLNESVTPLMIIARKNKCLRGEITEQDSEAGDSSETEILRLFVAEQDNEINPCGFPEYIAVF